MKNIQRRTKTFIFAKLKMLFCLLGTVPNGTVILILFCYNSDFCFVFKSFLNVKYFLLLGYFSFLVSPIFFFFYI